MPSTTITRPGKFAESFAGTATGLSAIFRIVPRSLRQSGGIWIMAGTLLLSIFSPNLVSAGPWPKAADSHRRTYAKEFRRSGEPRWLKPYYASQVHVESAWRNDAVSPVGARSLTQFMPITAEHVEQLDPTLIALGRWSERWAIRAQFAYMEKVRSYQSPPAREPLDGLFIAFRAYNRGWRWVRNERRLALEDERDPGIFENLPRYCEAAGPPSGCEEANHYVPKIRDLSHRYRFY